MPNKYKDSAVSAISTPAASENALSLAANARRPADGSHVVGVDLGGTKILGGIADGSGEVLATLNEPTAHGQGAPVLAQMARLVQDLAARAGIAVSDVRQVVIGVPGAVSPSTGLASLSPNLELPEGRPLAALMAERLPCPVIVENDVNLAAYAEASAGAGRGERSLAFVSFGTGVGMGLVLSGELIRGEFGRAGEIGYLPVGAEPHARAPKSVNGLFEDEVGTLGIRRRYSENGETVADIFEKAAQGDREAEGVIDDIARTASVGIAAIHSLIDPTLTVIGGGIGSQARFFDLLKTHLRPLLPFDCRIEPSRFGSQAGMIGAVMLGLHLAGDAHRRPA